jgi:hypothetical protein
MRMRAHVCALAIALVSLPRLAAAGSLSIAWDANTESDLAGYLVHYGTQPGAYSDVIDAGKQTSVTIPNLTGGQRYYVAVKAYNASGAGSTFSAEVSAVVAPSAPDDGLVAAYGFEEASGTAVVDSSRYGNGGTISGAARTASGRYGRALSFDGVNDLVTVTDTPSLDVASGMSLQAWVYPTALTGVRSLVMKEATAGRAYALYASDTATRPAAYVATSASPATDGASGTAQLPLNTWSHVTATYDGATLRLYVNGTLVDTHPVSGQVMATADPLRIGGNVVWGEYFAGRIDEVRIYNRPLAAAEITRDMNAAIVSGLVAAYGFEEASGTAATDTSGKGNNGTLQGAARTGNGRFGSALSFDGVNDWVTVPDAASLDSPRVTVEAWAYPTTLSGWRTAVLKEQTDGLVYGLYAHDNVPNPAMTIALGGVDQSASATASLALNTWTHLAATYDGTTVRLFVNGVQAGTRAVSGSLAASTGALRIGGNAVWGEYFSGRIDEVRIYNRALSAAEIQADMNQPVP